MGLLSWRDLQFRRRRFAIATLATALVFAIAVLLTGVSDSFDAEIDRTVGAFDARGWIVPDGGEGPFTNTRAFDATPLLDTIGSATGGAIAIIRVTPRGQSAKDLLVFGASGGFGPPATDGRDAAASGEVVVDKSFGADIGDRLDLGSRTFTVVGTYTGLTLFAGTPTATMAISDAQAVGFGGQRLATTVAVREVGMSVPHGFRIVSNRSAAVDVGRPLRQASSTLAFVRGLLWMVAVGIVGSIVYLTVIERTRDFAVLKATGVSGWSIFASVLVQAVLMSMVAATVAAALSVVLKPLVAMSIEFSASTYIVSFVVALGAGVLASLVGVRRALSVDPALAFG